MDQSTPLSGELHSPQPHRSRAAIAAAALGAWLLYVAADFWGHAVLLAGYWERTASYWRPPEELFRLIPVGYASFAIYCLALAWLLSRLSHEKLRPVQGGRLGALAGLVLGGAFWLGAYSVFRMPFSAVLLWTLWGVAESALAGAACVWVLSAERRGRRLGGIFAAALGLLVLGVVAQSILRNFQGVHP